ncbi:MAG TPA: hypothetical protein VNT42_13095 [Sphingomonas sp.]|nr:hypothetical protein [Sphingomonas sp.]
MAFAKLRQDYTPLPAPTAQLTSELDQVAPNLSPARALQQQLAQRAIAASGNDLAKWSPRRSLALIVSASAALWMAILMAGAGAVRLIA